MCRVGAMLVGFKSQLATAENNLRRKPQLRNRVDPLNLQACLWRTVLIVGAEDLARYGHHHPLSRAS